MGPAYVKVYTNKMDGSVFVEYFPDELTNTDFFRRVLAQVGYSLQAFVEAIVRAHGLVVVGKLGEDLKAVVEAVLKEYAPNVLVVVGAQDKTLKQDLENNVLNEYAAHVCVVEGCEKLKKAKEAVTRAHRDNKIVFLVEATRAAAPAPVPPAPPAAKVVVGAQGRKLKSLTQSVGATGKNIVFQSQHPEGIIGCDTYTLVKHVKHDKHIAKYAELLGCTDPKTLKTDPTILETALDEVMKDRNGLAHMTLDSAKKCLEELFTQAKDVVKWVDGHFKNKKNYLTMNMENLEKQWQTHIESRWRRQNALQLHVGNVPAGATERELAKDLNVKMHEAGLCTADDTPVISCSISQNDKGRLYAFAKLRSFQDADNCFNCWNKKGPKFKGSLLKIGRPDNYDPKIAAEFLACRLKDAAVALGASLADDAARQGVWSQLGEDAREVLRALCAAGKAPAESDAPRTVTPLRGSASGLSANLEGP